MSIVRMKATCGFYSEKNDLLSFKKGQQFYKLLEINGYYLVSTSYSTPLSQRAVFGKVPNDMFDIVKDYTIDNDENEEKIYENKCILKTQLFGNRLRKLHKFL